MILWRKVVGYVITASPRYAGMILKEEPTMGLVDTSPRYAGMILKG